MMRASSVFALFVGVFIIYNAFAIAVTQRRREIGILRALGATRSQIRSLFLRESAVSGVLGSLVGIGVGLLIARSISASVGGLLSDVYSVSRDTGDGTRSAIMLLGGAGAWHCSERDWRARPGGVRGPARSGQRAAEGPALRRAACVVIAAASRSPPPLASCDRVSVRRAEFEPCFIPAMR